MNYTWGRISSKLFLITLSHSTFGEREHDSKRVFVVFAVPGDLIVSRNPRFLALTCFLLFLENSSIKI